MPSSEKNNTTASFDTTSFLNHRPLSSPLPININTRIIPSIMQKERKKDNKIAIKQSQQKHRSNLKDKKEKYYPCLMDVLVDDESEDDDDDCGDSSFFSISTNSDDDTIITSNTFKKKHQEQIFSEESSSDDTSYVKYKHTILCCISESYCGIKTCFT